MTAHRWNTTLTVHGLAVETSTSVPVVAGLLETAAGGVQVALQVGEDRPVILAIQEAQQLSRNLDDTIIRAWRSPRNSSKTTRATGRERQAPHPDLHSA